MTLQELLARKDLVDRLVSYHIVPRVRAHSGLLRANHSHTIAAADAAAGAAGDGKAPGKRHTMTSYAVSGDGNYWLRFSVDAKTGVPVVRDVQGNEARVVGADLDAGKSVVHGIDRVLLSGAAATGRAQQQRQRARAGQALAGRPLMRGALGGGPQAERRRPGRGARLPALARSTTNRTQTRPAPARPASPRPAPPRPNPSTHQPPIPPPRRVLPHPRGLCQVLCPQLQLPGRGPWLQRRRLACDRQGLVRHALRARQRRVRRGGGGGGAAAQGGRRWGGAVGRGARGGQHLPQVSPGWRAGGWWEPQGAGRLGFGEQA
jgi:hypothetical protein